MESRDAHADPLTTSPPSFSYEEAEAIAERLFGVNGPASALDSERDQNFRIDSDDSRFLLKISNPADDPVAVEMQNEVALHVAGRDPTLPVMQPLRTVGGELIGEVEGAGGQKHLVRLFTWLPGRMMGAAELGADARYGFGTMLARMGLSLRGFFHPAAGYRILWDLKHTPELRPMLETIGDPQRRALVEGVLDRFDGNVRAALPGLRSQVIHNDFTLDNVLLDDHQRVSAIVDLGDTTHTALVCDLAISLASIMWGRPDPFEAVEATIAGFMSLVPLEEAEAEILGDLVAARLAASILINNWRVLRYEDNADYIMATEGFAWDLLDHFEAVGWERLQHGLRDASLDRTSPGGGTLPIEELLERRRAVLGPALSPPTYDEPLYLVRGEGVHMFDPDGNAYLDAYNNVPVVGHSHPRVAAAIAEQTKILNTNTRYLHQGVVDLAERLVATMPEGLDTVMFYNSGSEANDVAWRLAKDFTGGSGGIVTNYAYHGVTDATIALSPEGWAKDHQRPAHIELVPPPDGYRDALLEGAEGGGPYAVHVDDAIGRLVSRGVQPAAFIADALFTSDGIFTPPPAFLQDVARRVRDAGGLYIADEVQAGFGRNGSTLWSIQASGITPDFVTLGKPMGNGYPVAAVVTRREIADRFASKGDIFSTFGGNPVAARAALAVLDVLEEEDLQENAGEVGRFLREKLEELKERHAAIGDIRGEGLLIGVELVLDRATREPAPQLAGNVMNAMKRRRVLIGVTGPHENILKIRPPLVLAEKDACVIATTLDTALGETSNGD